MNKTTLFLALGFVLLWNSGFIGAEYGLPYAPPFTLLFWRYLALTIIILLYLLATKKLKWLTWKVAGSEMLIGILAHGVWLSCVLLSLDQGVPAGIVALVVALQPLATGALSPLVTGERTTADQWIGLVLGFFGVCLTLGFRIDFSSYDSIFGYLIPLGSVTGITIATLIQRRMDLLDEISTPPVDLKLFYQSLATMVALAFPAFFTEQLATQWKPIFIYTMIWLVFAVSLGAYALMWRLIKRLDATRVASLFYLGPPVTMVMAWLTFDDTLRTMDLVGMLIVFLGIAITYINPGKLTFLSRTRKQY